MTTAFVLCSPIFFPLPCAERKSKLRRGAGTSNNDVRKRGLTTASSLLATAPIGIAIALNRYIVAIGVTLLGLFILYTLRRLEDRLIPAGESSDESKGS
ncbi:MAG: MgtC/SapB family protein [Chthoniobacterales bacterium]